MKIKVQTLTGETVEVEMEEDSTVKQLKKAIYNQGKITGAVRVLKGSAILEDGSTLEKQKISDGDTVSLVIEPEHDIAVEVQCHPKTYQHNVSHSMTVKQLKTLLIGNNEVAFLYKEFDLVTFVTNKGIKQEIVLDDETMPLHYFSSEKYLKVHVMGPYLIVTSQSPYGQNSYHKVAKRCTVNELKNVILKSRCDDDVTDISMFVTYGNDSFKKLDPNEKIPLCSKLPSDQMIYFLEEKLACDSYYPIFYQDKEVGKVRSKLCNNDTNDDGTVLSVKLRIQEEMGIPTKSIKIYSWRGNEFNPRNKYILKNDSRMEYLDPYIEII